MALNVTVATSLSPDTGLVVPRATRTLPLPPVSSAEMGKSVPAAEILTNCNLSCGYDRLAWTAFTACPPVLTRIATFTVVFWVTVFVAGERYKLAAAA